MKPFEKAEKTNLIVPIIPKSYGSLFSYHRFVRTVVPNIIAKQVNIALNVFISFFISDLSSVC